MSIAVVYLARGKDAGLAAADVFFQSYEAHSANAAHDLVVITKGWEQQSDLDQLRAKASTSGARLIDLPDDGFDWGAYIRVTPLLTQRWVCFLNSHSRILVDGWLGNLYSAIKQPGVAAAGATGSWGTPAPVFQFIAPTVLDINRNVGWVKALIASSYLYTFGYAISHLSSRRDFPPFPNPHLRSNAFIIERKTFIGYSNKIALPHTKRDAFALESGRRSLTRFLAACGLNSVVVGADGLAYKPDEWIRSGTFRVPGQPNLIVGDNQTWAYDAGRTMSRRMMERSAWGQTFTPIKTDQK